MGFGLNEIGRLVALGGVFCHHGYTVKTTRARPACMRAVAYAQYYRFDLSEVHYVRTKIATLLRLLVIVR